MTARGHLWKRGVAGRSLGCRPGIGSMTTTAQLRCARCDAVAHRNLTTLMPPEQIDRKFIQIGWRLDPPVCPKCNLKPKEKTMSAKPTPPAMKASAHMHKLLEQHFDMPTGRFSAGWSDARIAKEAGLDRAAVAAWRCEVFGELREPPELAAIRDDINAVEALARDQIAELRGKLAQLGAKLGLAA